MIKRWDLFVEAVKITIIIIVHKATSTNTNGKRYAKPFEQPIHGNIY
jgi:hypothetical protein